MVEWFLFLPQVRLSVADIAERARYAEDSGFDGIAFIDHLEAPGLPGESIWEAMSIATWVAAKTQRLRIGHLVLCDAFRHPAVLAKQAVTLSDASDGRFELGLGSGSWPAEFTRFDVGQQDPVARVEQLGRHLALIRQYWGDSGEDADATQLPKRTHPIPLVLGGSGPRMMELVRSYADWWNLQANHLDRLPKLASAAGTARVSIQQMVGFVRSGSDPNKVRDVSTRRFGNLGPGLVCGDADELVAHFNGLAAQRVERFYVWFADFAVPGSLAEFGESVIKALVCLNIAAAASLGGNDRRPGERTALDGTQPDLRQVHRRVDGVQPCDRLGDVGHLDGVHLEGDVLQHLGFHRSRRHDVHRDTVAVDFERQGAGKRVHAGFGRRVGGPGHHRLVCRRRRDEHQS